MPFLSIPPLSLFLPGPLSPWERSGEGDLASLPLSMASRVPIMPPTPRTLRAAAIFSLPLPTPTPADPDTDSTADHIDAHLPPGHTCLLTGPSGAGKSTTLRRLAARLGDAAIPAPAPHALAHITTRVADLTSSPLTHFMRLLAAAGLAEAAVLLARACDLSEGQRARLGLALAMDEALRRPRSARPITLLADEFASTLDRATARSLARTASRWAARTGVRLVAATAHDDLAAHLAPSLIATFSLSAPPRIERRPAPNPGSIDTLIDIAPGAPADLAALSRWHYRAGPPATCIHMLSARWRESGDLAGVLAVSMPALNSPLRDLAWPGRYTTGDKPRDARRLNAELRTISRVIVDPRYRAIGVAAALVRAYLARPLTPATEALAAMGPWCPFFVAAGMTPYTLPLPRRHARLLDALDAIGLSPWRLADPGAVLAHLRRRPDAAAAFLARELALWADASRATRRLARAPLRELLQAAARSGLNSRPIGYAHTAAATTDKAAA